MRTGKRAVFVLMTVAVLTGMSGCTGQGQMSAKPVIYLYPEQTEEVSVELEYDGDLTCTYPEYNGGWQVTAYPDGTLTDQETGKTYNYLFWEGTDKNEYDLTKGFVVPGEDTAEFLEEKLTALGLNERERNEFIVYWLPRMQDNEYNLIAFQGQEYTEHARLKISPEPDSILRVFMAYQPLDEPVDVPEQELAPFVREGFTVVEWGGTEME